MYFYWSPWTLFSIGYRVFVLSTSAICSVDVEGILLSELRHFFFLFLLQFDEEECLCKAPLPECWVVRKLLYDVVCAAFSNHYVSLVNQMSHCYVWCLVFGVCIMQNGHENKQINLINFQVSKLHMLIDTVTASYDKYFFGDVGRETYDFFWSDFADWYVQ